MGVTIRKEHFALIMSAIVLLASVVMVVDLNGATSDDNDAVFGISKVGTVNELNNTTESAIMIGADSNFDDRAAVKAVAKKISEGMKVITTDGEMIKRATAPIFSGYSVDADLYGIYYDPETGASYCISILSDNEDFIEKTIDDWMSDVASNNVSRSSIPGLFAGQYTIASDGTDSARGVTEIVSRYYFMEENDPRYNYFYVNTEIKVTAYALANWCNCVDYINTTVDIEGADVGDRILVDYGPRTTDTSASFSISIGYPPSISVSFDFDADSVSSNYNQNTGILQINQDYGALGSLQNVVKETSIAYSVISDSQGPNGCTDYVARETYVTGLEYTSPYTMKSNYTMAVDVQAIATTSGDRFWYEVVI